MTLHTQIPIPVEPQVAKILAPLGPVTRGTGHRLQRPRIKNFLADGMGKLRVFLVTSSTHGIDRSREHIRIIGTMGRMTVSTGICRHVLELGSIVPMERVQMTGTANITFPPFEQTLVIAGMGGMASGTAILSISYQMVV
jgi:hypothetical protein